MTTEPVAAVSLPSERQRPRSPARVLQEAEAQWLFTEEELDHTPSIRAGMTAEEELDRRARGVIFIKEVGMMLKLPEVTLSVAALFFHRYLMRNSLKGSNGAKGIHHYTLGATALFLATKVEECCRKLKELVIACCRAAQKNPNLLVDESSKDFWKWRDTILLNEDILLETLCFDLTVESPHKLLFSMLKSFRLEHNKTLRNAAWAFVTDSPMTPLCVLGSSRVIAATALYVAASICEVKIPDHADGRPWWESQRVSIASMVKATNYMAKAYEKGPPGGDAGKSYAAAAAAATGGSVEDLQAIYVGLFADFDTESAHTDGQGPVWDRTRLKSEQSIPTPPGVVEETNGKREDTMRAIGEAEQGGQKRGREAASLTAGSVDARTGDDGDSAKRRKTTEGATSNGAEPPAASAEKCSPEQPVPQTVLSEEGEVEE